jgi:large subunit ribosomal protein L31e
MSKYEEKTGKKASEAKDTKETLTEPENETVATAEEETTETIEEETEELPEEAAEEGEQKPEETAIEEEKVEKPKREKETEDIVEERFYTIPLRKAWLMARRKRTPRAMRIIRSFVEKHMKIGATKTEEKETDEEEEEERLIISAELNEKIWARGIQKPPRRIKVRVVKDSEGTVTVYPAEGD